jgi:nitrite reductase (NO-forming)
MKKYVYALALMGFGLYGYGQNIAKGKSVYTQTCIACHQPTGVGIPGAFPPLAKSDYLNKDVNRAIKTVIKGLNGPITVNGKKFSSAMPPQALTDQQIADVLTYVFSSWGNTKTVVTPAMVKAQRK